MIIRNFVFWENDARAERFGRIGKEIQGKGLAKSAQISVALDLGFVYVFSANFPVGSAAEGRGIARSIGRASGAMYGAREPNVHPDNNIVGFYGRFLGRWRKIDRDNKKSL